MKSQAFYKKKRIHFPARKMLSSWSPINSNWKNRWLVESLHIGLFSDPLHPSTFWYRQAIHFDLTEKKSQVAHSRYCSTTKHDSSDPIWELRTSKPEKTVRETGETVIHRGRVHLPPHQSKKGRMKWWKWWKLKWWMKKIADLLKSWI